MLLSSDSYLKTLFPLPNLARGKTNLPHNTPFKPHFIPIRTSRRNIAATTICVPFSSRTSQPAKSYGKVLTKQKKRSKADSSTDTMLVFTGTGYHDSMLAFCSNFSVHFFNCFCGVVPGRSARVQRRFPSNTECSHQLLRRRLQTS